MVKYVSGVDEFLALCFSMGYFTNSYVFQNVLVLNLHVHFIICNKKQWFSFFILLNLNVLYLYFQSRIFKSYLYFSCYISLSYYVKMVIINLKYISPFRYYLKGEVRGHGMTALHKKIKAYLKKNHHEGVVEGEGGGRI